MVSIDDEKGSLVSLTANIVSANVSNNPMAVGDLCEMIKSVHSALSKLESPEEEKTAKRDPAVPIRSSIKEDYIVCLEDGKKLKTLKRYLRARYQMTPEEYRAKWGLPPDYPMAAPSYTNQRRELAHKIGLGLRAEPKGKRTATKLPSPVEKDAPKPPATSSRRKSGRAAKV